MRVEIEELVRICHDLAQSAHENNGALTNLELETVATCIQTLHEDVLLHKADDDRPIDTSLGVLPPIVD